MIARPPATNQMTWTSATHYFCCKIYVYGQQYAIYQTCDVSSLFRGEMSHLGKFFP